VQDNQEFFREYFTDEGWAAIGQRRRLPAAPR
jgi:hypothetical protein